MEIVQTILTLAAGAAIASIGYLIKRRIEKTPSVEKLNRAQQVLDLHKQMKEQGLTLTDLYVLEKNLLSDIKNEIQSKGIASLDKNELIKMVANYAAVSAVLVEPDIAFLKDSKAQSIYDAACKDFYEAYDFLVSAQVDSQVIDEFEKVTDKIPRPDKLRGASHDAPNNSFNPTPR
jgi:hypothetical protein